MGNVTACCVNREREDDAPFKTPHNEFSGQFNRSESWHSIVDPEESWSLIEYEDCVESEGESPCTQPNLLKRKSTVRRKTLKQLLRVPEEMSNSQEPSSPSQLPSPWKEVHDKYGHLVPELTAGVRRHWAKRLEKRDSLPEEVLHALDMEEGVPELDEWTSLLTCLRILRAIDGDIKQGTSMLVKAVEVRVRDREFYSSLECEVTSDVRVIGRDVDRRPVVYMCALNQRTGIAESMFQVFLAFEAAVKLAEADGQLWLIADMKGFRAGHFLDSRALMKMADTMGTVFADRIYTITIVDFSFIAQGLWRLGQPLLMEKTKKKIAFVSEREARESLKEKLQPHTFDRLVSAFDINRDKTSTPEDREEHAQKTSICDVPLGSWTARPSSVTALTSKWKEVFASPTPEAAGQDGVNRFHVAPGNGQ